MTVWRPNKTAVVLAVALAGALSAAAARLLATSQSTQPAHAEDARVIREPDALGEATPVSAISVEAAAKLKEVFAAHRGFAAGVSQEIMTSSGFVEPDHTGTI